MLPASLSVTLLSFGDDFDRPLAEGVLPATLIQLTFGFKFNQPLEVGVLPPSLIDIEFGYTFINQHLGLDVLPVGLLKLAFDSHGG